MFFELGFLNHNTKMDTIFMNSENSRTSEYHVLALKLTNKLDLRRGQKNCCVIKS